MTDSALTPLGEQLLPLAIEFHKTIEGEYGCPGATCPGVQRLVAAFAALKGVGQRDSLPGLTVTGPADAEGAATAAESRSDSTFIFTSLISKWRKKYPSLTMVSQTADDYWAGQCWGVNRCADELEKALSLSRRAEERA